MATDAVGEMVESALQAQGFYRYLGTRLEEVASGRCVLSLERRDELLQQNGYFHGGVAAYLVDNATAAAAATVLRQGQSVLTAEYKLNFLSPAKGERLVCRAEVEKAGRRMTVVSARVHCEAEAEAETVVALALATIAIVNA